MDLRTRSTMFAGECIRNACRKFPDFRASSNQFGPNDNSTHLYDHRRNGIPIYHDTSHGICYATPPSPQCPSTTTVDSGLRHHSDRFQWSIRHRFARRERERIQVARLDLRPGFPSGTFFFMDSIAFNKSSIETNGLRMRVRRTEHSPRALRETNP